MKVYISQLTETKNIIDILRKYDVGLEIVLFAHPNYLDKQDEYIEIYKKELGDLYGKIEIGLHGPFVELSPGSRDNMIVDVTKYRFKQAFEVAKKMNSKHIVFHSGYITNAYTYIEWIKNATKFWNEFASEIYDENIDIFIENVFEENYQILNEFFEKINQTNISLCLDIGHINAYSKVDVRDWIKVLDRYIKHMHIHNNLGDRDSHLGINKGNLDVIEILNMFKDKDIKISLEITDLDELKESLEILYKNKIINLRE